MNYKERIDKAYKDNYPETEMSKEDTGLFIFLLRHTDQNLKVDINTISKDSEIYQHFKPIVESFVAQVFLKRLEHFTTLKISLGALIMLLLTMESPGAAVMTIYYLHRKLKPNTLIDINMFKEAFPDGSFSQEQLNKIWEAQKVRKEDFERTSLMPDNLLDYLETWK